MATLCTHCGTALKDTARYCNNCGTLVPTHPFSSKFVPPAPPDGQSRRTGIMSEQIAQHSPSHPVRKSVPGEPPSWMSQLDNQFHNESKAPTHGMEEDRQGTPSEKGRDPSWDFLSRGPVYQPGSAAGGLHVKVWEQEEPVSAGTSREPLMPAQKEEQTTVEDVPTRPLIISSESKLVDKLTQPNGISSPASRMPGTHFEAMEQLDTAPLLKAPAAPAYTPSNSRAVMHGNSPAFTYSPDMIPTQDMRQTHPPQDQVPRKSHRKSRKPLVLVSLLLLVLVAGLGTWAIIWQPFTVPGITQPQQNFKDTRLGFSLLYPSGWRFQVDPGRATAQFYDSSHTAQVNIRVGFANGGDPGQYLQQEASKLGMTGQTKGPPLSMAGASWQQIRGSVLERGASYTETVIVTVHNQHLFTILLLAPQSTYAQEDQLIFSGMRSSFQFVE